MRVLFADDNEDLRESACEFLTGKGHTVLPCTSGIEAIGTYQVHWQSIDVVLLDLEMPGANGWETFLRMQRICASVPVVVVSGSEGESEGVRRLLHVGAHSYLRKPFRLAELLSVVESCVSGGHPHTLKLKKAV